MDTKTDKLLHEKLFEYNADKTLIVITDRLENIEKFDRIVVLEKWEIVVLGHVTEIRKFKMDFLTNYFLKW